MKSPLITNSPAPAKQLLSKVPEVTIWFWIIKILCTTVGETAADFLNVNLNFGLGTTSVVTGVLLAVVLVGQFRSSRYIPALYWTTVALVSVFGTLVTDNLTDNLGFPLEASTLIFGGLLALTFALWYRSEGTLSIHSIVTRRREMFYWLAILFTFALGTAAGDLMAEGLGLGYTRTGLIVASLIALAAIGWKLGLNSILAFWFIYILTRPLGASIGDFLSQPTEHGGLGLGATLTTVFFVVGILGIVIYLSVTRADAIPANAAGGVPRRPETGGKLQTILVVCVLVVAGGTGYFLRRSSVDAGATADGASAGSAVGPAAALGDLTTFRVITQDTETKLTAGDQVGATSRVDDLEYEWDNAQAVLKARDDTAWTLVDGEIDTVLRELRSTAPVVESEKSALDALLATLGQ